ncbi:MAG: sigma-70 family RNA polymerase sigma factor [Bryobacterales bacterium]|nr:sigma-70 family RNA polymerase sigma factor [Bryobacterales bacterium]MDE0260932.1 sigma-70 family RNA polymerase sigma factor [Bryobacterales bacterium]MDE0624574.1 sigma-70 family RNA polymerase sigma factor [Bryobacterales bacterium]
MLPSALAESDLDADLVCGLKARKPGSYELLLRRYQRPVYSYVCRLIDDHADAEDVTQEVFVKVFRRVDSFRGSSTFKTWLYRIATNEASNKRRWFSRHRAWEVSESSVHSRAHEFSDSFRSEAVTPFEHTTDRERRDILNGALQALDPRFREAVVLRDVEDFSYGEIADTLGVPLGTVKSRILRGREALKRHLLRNAPSIAPRSARWQLE